MLLALLAEPAVVAMDDGHEAGAGAFPAFETWHWASQAFWLIITFAILYLVLGRFILKKLAGTIERRSDTIVGALDEAHRLNEQAEEAQQALQLRLSEARAKARDTAAAAQDKVRAEIARQTEKNDREIEAKLEEAEARIGEMQERAMKEVRGIATETAAALVSALGGTASKAEVEKAVERSLEGAR